MPDRDCIDTVQGLPMPNRMFPIAGEMQCPAWKVPGMLGSVSKYRHHSDTMHGPSWGTENRSESPTRVQDSRIEPGASSSTECARQAMERRRGPMDSTSLTTRRCLSMKTRSIGYDMPKV